MNFFKKSIRWNFLISCILLSSCSNQSQIPFKNIPHIQYFNLNGKVKEVQVNGYICAISKDGYDSPKILNIQNCHPVDNILLLGGYFIKNEIDICFTPIEKYQYLCMIFNSPKISNITYSFTEKGYLSNMDLFWNEKKIKSLRCTFDKNNLLNQMNQYELFNAIWKISDAEYVEKKDTIESTYLYNGSQILETKIVKTNNSIQTYKTSYIFEKADDKVIERIHLWNNYIDSAYIYEENGDIYKIEYFQDVSKQKNIDKETVYFLRNNIIYKQLPDVMQDKLYDSKNRLIEDSYYKYTYNSNGLYQTIYKKIYNIESNVSYEIDGHGNWIKMEIVPIRYEMDQLYNKLENLLDENIYYREKLKEYYRMNYPPIDKVEQILNSLEKNNEYIDKVKYLIRSNQREEHFDKIIIQRDISYYDEK